MKMSVQTYSELRDAIRSVVDCCGPAAIRKAYRENSTRTLWDLFYSVAFDKQNEDSHPAYQRGRRRFVPYCRHDWLNHLYETEQLNDGCIATALRRAAKELDLLRK